ncbi:MAG: glycosyltransferase [Planctomycetes bacterium]|nr:glycosyltransferase [Planctomycetota bacterium]
MNAPRVLLAGAVLAQGFGGVRRHNQELLPRAARLLAQDGGGLTVLAGRDGVSFELPAPIECLTSTVPSGPPLARAALEGRALRRALDEARTRGAPFDLVHTAHLPAPRALPTPYTLTLHDLRGLLLEHTAFSRRFFAAKVIGGAVQNAAAVIAVSETVRATLAAHFKPRRLFVVPNAGDHLAVRPRAPLADAALLHVGHLEPRKNLELLLRTLALDPTLPALELAGAAKHGEDERLQALARELGVAARVRFLGAVAEADLPQLYARCAAVVIPSRLEGFGIGVLEAQRARAPLAIAAAGALPEVAGDGVPHFGVDDAAGCARALRDALAQPSSVLEEHARRAERFSWDASARALVAAWTAATARSQG